MISTLEQLVAVENYHDRRDGNLAAQQVGIVHPIWRCKWCKPHRWFMRRLDSSTMYVDAPTDGRIPSDGICRPCRDKIFPVSTK